MAVPISPFFHPVFSFVLLALLSLVAVRDIKADLITDPAGDFLPSYTGPKNGDLDVVSAQVFFNGSSFLFTSTEAAPIGTTSGAVYVWGIDRGAGSQGFPGLAPGVLFDSIFIINPAGGSTVRDLINNTSTAISNISFSGSTISGTVPLSALPSLGRAPSQYTVNLWPRFGGVTGNVSGLRTTSCAVEPEASMLGTWDNQAKKLRRAGGR